MSPQHHLLWPRRLWNAQDTTKHLRRNGCLQVSIGEDEHSQIHKDIELVPVPGYIMARSVIREFVPQGDDPRSNIDALCFAFNAASKLPRVGIIEHRLGELIIATLQVQKEYL